MLRTIFPVQYGPGKCSSMGRHGSHYLRYFLPTVWVAILNVRAKRPEMAAFFAETEKCERLSWHEFGHSDDLVFH